MKKHFLSVVLVTFVLLNLGCKKAPTEPPPDDKTTLEYDWEVDTLFNPHGYGVVPWAMWGSSPIDVWTVGFNLAGQGEMFHYDGVEWKRVTPDLGFNYQLSSVFGFSDNDIYIAGAEIIIDTVLHGSNLLLHYNGVDLKQINVSDGKGLIYVHGRNSDDIWACGYYGTLYHKTGNAWQKISFNSKLNLGPIWTAPSGEVFMMSEYFDYPITADTAMFYFSKFSSNNWEILDSCRLVSVDGIRTGYTFGEKAIWGIGSNEIYSAGTRGLFQFNGSGWQLIYWDDYLYKDLKGNSNGNVFVVGDHGTINYSINNQWKRIGDYSRYDVDFYSVMPFENEIFIGAYQLGEGYVVRGKAIQ